MSNYKNNGERFVTNNGGGYIDWADTELLDEAPLIMPTINFANDDKNGDHHRLNMPELHGEGELINNVESPLIVPGLFDFDS